MPTYRSKLPPLGKHQGFELRRTPITGSLQAIITCENILVCDTHFYHGRTTPCERLLNDEEKTIDDTICHPCIEKIGYRTHVYVSAFDPKKSEHFIFECTSNAATPLEDYRDTTGTVRGCIFHATRPKGTPNSKVFIETNTANLTRVQIPPGPDLIRALAVIWRLPGIALDVVPDHKKNGKVRPLPNRMKNMRDQPDNIQEAIPLADIVKDLFKTC